MNLRQLAHLIIEYAAKAHIRRISYKSNTAEIWTDKAKEIVIIGDTWGALRIAQLGIQAGHNVIMINPSKGITNWFGPRIRERVKDVAKRKYRSPLDQEKFTSESMNRLQHATSPYKFFQKADVIVESTASDNTFQKLMYKRKLIKEWSLKSPSTAILVFTHPTLIDKMAVISTASARRHNVIGINFLHPIHVLRLAEIITIYGSANDFMRKTIAWLTEMGIASVEVNKSDDIQRRLYHLSDVLHKVEDGSLTIRDADRIAQLRAGLDRFSFTRLGTVMRPLMWLFSLVTVARFFMFPTLNFSNTSMTPFEMADFIGLDKSKLIIDEMLINMLEERGNKYEESQLLKDLISKGKLGRRTGEGFYSYKDLK